VVQSGLWSDCVTGGTVWCCGVKCGLWCDCVTGGTVWCCGVKCGLWCDCVTGGTVLCCGLKCGFLKTILSPCSGLRQIRRGGRLGSRLWGYYPVAPMPFKVRALYSPPLVPPVLSRGAPRHTTRETSVSKGRNWARNDRSIWPAILNST
jgi:hypothetical protein